MSARPIEDNGNPIILQIKGLNLLKKKKLGTNREKGNRLHVKRTKLFFFSRSLYKLLVI